MSLNNSTKTGDCECCPDKKDVNLTNSNGMWMCDGCYAANSKAVAESATKMIEESRAIDSSIQIKTDIFVARTVAAIELRGAIDNNPDIPADQKDYTYAKECYDRYKHLQKVIFEDRQALLEKENELRMWQVNVQTTAGKLRQEYRDQFKALDVSYQPAQPKTVKPKKTKTGTSKPRTSSNQQREEAKQAAIKFDIAEHYLAVQSLMIAKNLQADDAAREMCKMMGKSI